MPREHPLSDAKQPGSSRTPIVGDAVLGRTLGRMCAAIVCSTVWLAPLEAQSNIDADHKFSWSENAGWMNWRDADGGQAGVQVSVGFLSGYIWGENFGWINVGDGNAPYDNTDNTDYGVNIQPNGDLDGFAWGENIGWINFGWAKNTLNAERARFDITAVRFRGWAWAENIGWINLDDDTHFVSVGGAPSSPPLPDVIQSKNRYLSFIAGDSGRTQAVRVTFQALPGAHASLNGTQMWVQEPSDFCENSGQDGPPCIGETYKWAGLGCTPHFMDWSEVGVVHVSHAGVVPGGVYDIQVVDEAGGSPNESDFSAPLTLTQAKWGDCCGPFTGGAWPGPDASVDVTVDIVAGLNKFRNLPGAPIKAQVDMEPAEPDRLINITDITRGLDAFRGFPYPFSPGPAPCP